MKVGSHPRSKRERATFPTSDVTRDARLSHGSRCSLRTGTRARVVPSVRPVRFVTRRIPSCGGGLVRRLGSSRACSVRLQRSFEGVTLPPSSPTGAIRPAVRLFVPPARARRGRAPGRSPPPCSALIPSGREWNRADVPLRLRRAFARACCARRGGQRHDRVSERVSRVVDRGQVSAWRVEVVFAFAGGWHHLFAAWHRPQPGPAAPSAAHPGSRYTCPADCAKIQPLAPR
jgi:hypothetical protein